MKIYIRKVSSGCWQDKEIDDIDSATIDPITKDFRTLNNDLSIWEFEIDSFKRDENKRLRILPENIEHEIMVTLGLSGTDFSKINITYLKENEIEAYDFVLDKEGKTLYSPGKRFHGNIKLNYTRLKELYVFMNNSYNKDRNIFFLKKEIKDKTIELLEDIDNEFKLNDLCIPDPCGKTKYYDTVKKVVKHQQNC